MTNKQKITVKSNGIISITFEKVVVKSLVKGICPHCKKRAQKTCRFSKTINPWNTKENVEVMLRDEILSELEAKKYQHQQKYASGKEAIWHNQCWYSKDAKGEYYD